MTRISYVIHITGYVIAQPTCTCHAQSDPVSLDPDPSIDRIFTDDLSSDFYQIFSSILHRLLNTRACSSLVRLARSIDR